MNIRSPAGYNLLHYSVALVAGCASLYLFFFKQINNGFSYIFGDKYDAVIESVLVSHWYHVLGFTQAWNQPLYFYPYPDVLGYNDGYFLYGLIGAAYRVMGFDIFHAQALVHVTVKALGFVSMLILLNRLHGRSLINALGAALFTLAINSSVQAVHGQMLAIAFSPLLTMLLLGGVRAAVVGARKAFLLYGLVFVSLFNSLLITAYYASWFFGLFAIVYVASYAVMDREAVKKYIRAMYRLKLQALIIGAWFVATVIPFLYVYLPKLKQTGGQSYGNQLYYSLHLADLMNYGSGSLLWGWLTNRIDGSFPNLMRLGEYSVGYTPDILLVMAFVVYSLRANKPRMPVWVKVLAAAVLVSAALPISVDGHSLWFFVRTLVPGAAGLRTISRYYLFLAFPMAILISVYFERLGGFIRNGRLVGAMALALLCAGQINLAAPTYLNVPRETAIVDPVGKAPGGCASFFVSNPVSPAKSRVDRIYRQNVQAMLLADKVNIPTLNGLATFNPPDWIFVQDGGYLQRVREYVARHKLKGVCRYDFSGRRWYVHVPGDVALMHGGMLGRWR